ncbi:MAG: diguanylate cyclase [Candidatus Limnocylindrales bacterium]
MPSRTPAPEPIGAAAGLRTDRMRALLDVARELTGTFDLQTILHTIVRSVNDLLGTDLAIISLRVEDHELRPMAWDDRSDAMPPLAPLPVSSPFVADLLDGRSWSCDSSDASPAGLDLAAWARHPAHAFAPLMRNGGAFGILEAAWQTPHAWTEEEMAFLELIASQAAIAIQNADVIAKSSRWADQLAVMQASVARLNRLNTVEAVGRAIVEETRRIVDYHNCRVYLLRPPDRLEPIAFASGREDYPAISLEQLAGRVGEGLTGWVAQHDQPLLIDDAEADPRALHIPGTVVTVESMVIVPMHFDAQVIGVVALAKLGLRQFDELDLRLMRVLADAAGSAIETARAFEEAHRREREMRSLLALSGEVAATLDPQRAADLAARHVADVFEADAVTILFRAPDARGIATLGVFPPTDHVAREVRRLEAHPLIGRVMADQGRVVVRVSDALADPAEVARLRTLGMATTVFVPLLTQHEVIGVLRLRFASERACEAETLDFMQAMANQAAMALENARLYQEARDLADHDPPTGCYNHRYLHERLGEEFLRARRSRRPLALLMLDLDDFKLVNDTLGHQVGDRVLRWSADLVRATLRESDVLARYGGDEFAVILPEADREAARAVVGRIARAFASAAFQAPERSPVPIGVSIGLAVVPDDARTASELVGRADEDLYRVKRAAERPAEDTRHVREAVLPAPAGPEAVPPEPVSA